MGMERIEDRTYDDIGSYIGAHISGHTKVGDLLEKKGRQVCTISPTASVLEALRLMAECEVGALVVLEDGQVAGMISERDYARKVILIGKTSQDTTVREIMSWPARTVTRDNDVSECMNLMTDRHIRHLPVVEKGVLVGILSIGDLVKSIIADQDRRIEQYRRYISGAYPA